MESHTSGTITEFDSQNNDPSGGACKLEVLVLVVVEVAEACVVVLVGSVCEVVVVAVMVIVVVLMAGLKLVVADVVFVVMKVEMKVC